MPYTRLDPDAVFVSSDFHLSHGNSKGEEPRGIIKHQKRPFKCIEEMDEAIISGVNKKVPADATFIFCGDWCWYDPRRDKVSFEEKACSYRERIACKNVFFCWGNHDRKLRSSSKFRSTFKGCYDLLDLAIGGQKVVFSHYALKVWDGSRHGGWNVYGHSHDMLDEGLSQEDVNKLNQLREVVAREDKTSAKEYLNLLDAVVRRSLPGPQTDVGIDTRKDYTVYSWSEVVAKVKAKDGDKRSPDFVWAANKV